MALQSPFRLDALAGQVVLITGGGSGIGLEIARQLGLHGCKVAMTGRRAPVLKAAEEMLRGEGIECVVVAGDVRQGADCERWVRTVLEKWGTLNILVNCAAGNFLALPEDLTANGFRTVMEIDAVGTFNMSRAAFGALKDSRNGRIINISATLHYGATWYQVHASAAKAAVDSITRSLALEWGQFGIAVNGIAPGAIKDTAGISKLAPGTTVDPLQLLVEATPLGRMGTKTDIALSCVFLASSAGSFVSGHVLVVDGASWMWRPQPIPRAVVARESRGVEATSRQVGIGRSKL